LLVRILHPENPKQHAFVPVHYNPETAEWVSLVADGTYFESEFDAAHVCVDHLTTLWTEIARIIRVIRALCEHPAFEFHGDGVDDEMVRFQARALARCIEPMTEELSLLLQEPGVRDRIDVDGALIAIHIDIDSHPADDE